MWLEAKPAATILKAIQLGCVGTAGSALQQMARHADRYAARQVRAVHSGRRKARQQGSPLHQPAAHHLHSGGRQAGGPGH